MAKLNWKDIITRVANNCGIDQVTPFIKSSIQGHIKDTLIKIHRVAEDNVKPVKYAIFDGKTMADTPTIQVIDDPLLAPDGMDLGEHLYKFAYYNPIQGESALTDFTLSAIITVAQQKVGIFGIPQLPHGVTEIRIYKTKSDGAIYFLHSAKTDNLTYFYDTKKDTDLTVPYSAPAKFADESNVIVPDDFLALKQALFYDTSNVELMAVEAYSEEQFQRFSPEDVVEESTIRDIMDGSLPYNTNISEGSMLDGSTILYVVQDTLPVSFNYKRRFNGYLQWLYIAVPEPSFAALTASPDVMYAYYDVIVEGATYRYSRTLLLKAKTDAEAQALVLAVRLSKADFSEALKNYLGFTKKTAEVQILQVPNILNDSSMEL